MTKFFVTATSAAAFVALSAAAQVAETDKQVETDPLVSGATVEGTVMDGQVEGEVDTETGVMIPEAELPEPELPETEFETEDGMGGLEFETEDEADAAAKMEFETERYEDQADDYLEPETDLDTDGDLEPDAETEAEIETETEIKID